MSNEQSIWNFLMKKYNNPYGVAALMGNLYVESRLDPELAESSKIKKLGMTNSEYIQKVDSGAYSKADFSHDGIGFGLAQWTYWARKQSLYEHARNLSLSIADNEVQLLFMYKELSESYKTVHQAILEATDIRTCSDVIVKRYEKPKHQTEDFLAKRAKYGQVYFDRYAKKPIEESAREKKKYVVATANVNLRCGNGKQYARVGGLFKGKTLPYVAESENGWYAAAYKEQIVWLSKEYSMIEEI